jgi:8-oxo-dGTP diphosphatase
MCRSMCSMAPTDASKAPLQFGTAQPGVDYADRPAAFAVVARGRSIAAVRITREGTEPFYDLPGGALEPGEIAEQAAVREFGEETGLLILPVRVLGSADQFIVKSDGSPANNRSVLFEADLMGEDKSLKIEADHELVWLDADLALRRLRHDSHAWAVLAWLRRAPESGPNRE